MKDKRLASMEDSLDQIFDTIPRVLEAQMRHRFLRLCVCYKQTDNSTKSCSSLQMVSPPFFVLIRTRTQGNEEDPHLQRDRKQALILPASLRCTAYKPRRLASPPSTPPTVTDETHTHLFHCNNCFLVLT